MRSRQTTASWSKSSLMSHLSRLLTSADASRAKRIARRQIDRTQPCFVPRSDIEGTTLILRWNGFSTRALRTRDGLGRTIAPRSESHQGVAGRARQEMKLWKGATRCRPSAFALQRGLTRKPLVRLGTESEIEFVHRDPSLAHLPHTDRGPKTLASELPLSLIFSVLAPLMRSDCACDFA